MSIKTIALDSRVYERLARVKEEGESFSKVVDRLLTEVESAHTGTDVLRGLASMPAISDAESKALLEVVAQNRIEEKWERRDLR
jgi:predicted CopG family antitoxin